MDPKDLIRDISKRNGLSHIGSSLTALPIIEEIYAQKQPDEKFVLSCGHAHLAHLVIMNPLGAEKLLLKYGIHCSREAGCDFSTGSLGHGLGAAVGMALSDRSKNVYCLISDGECAEGSIWEALRIAHENSLNNLKVYVNANGWASYEAVELDYLEARLKTFFPVDFRRTENPDDLRELKGHYGKL